MKTATNNKGRNAKKGAALIVALWVMILLALIDGSFAFESNLEAMLVSYKRKKFRSQVLAHSGIEYAKALLAERTKAKELEIENMDEDKDGFMQAALYVQRGLTTSSTIPLGDGQFTVTISPADSGRNVNLLTRDQWLDIFQMANIPSTEWDAMIDCLTDWIDEGDAHGLSGAESDDPFYEDRGYPVKNGPLDSVEELLLIKNWGPDILYGRPADEEHEAIHGIADLLTVWGDGKVNLNSATTNQLLSFGEYDESELGDVIYDRLGPDGEPDTLDDGIKNLADVNADASIFKLQSNFVKVTSVGDAFGNKYQIECIFLLNNNDAVVVYWNEGSAK